MKSVLMFAVTSLAASFAFAWPSAGDTATYAIVASASGMQQTAIIQQTIKEINAQADEMSVETTVVTNGTSSVDVEKSKYSEAQQFAAQVPFLVSNCASVGGTAETVTVPAGTFATCKMATSAGHVWFADVVFGWVKMSETQDGVATEGVLTSYKAN